MLRHPFLGQRHVTPSIICSLILSCIRVPHLQCMPTEISPFSLIQPMAFCSVLVTELKRVCILTSERFENVRGYIMCEKLLGTSFFISLFSRECIPALIFLLYNELEKVQNNISFTCYCLICVLNYTTVYYRNTNCFEASSLVSDT